MNKKIKDENEYLTSLTKWFFTVPNKGWKDGIRVIQWKGEDGPRVQIQRWRTNKKRIWVLTKTYVCIRLKNFNELFNPKTGVVNKMIEAVK